MKQKTSKKVSFVLAAALCAAIAVPVVSALSGAGTEGGSLFNGVYGSTFTAFAEESAAETENATYTMQTKGMYSLNNDYLLLTTNIDDVTKYKEVGYTVSENGEEATDTGSDTYYESITFKTDAAGGTRTDTMAEIFEGNVVTGMIVTEIEYSAESSYSITPYLVTNEGEKESGKTVNVPAAITESTIQLDAVKQAVRGSGTKGIANDSTSGGNRMAGNLSQNVGASLTFSFTAADAGTAELIAAVTHRNSENKFTDTFDVYVNGVQMTSDAVIPTDGNLDWRNLEEVNLGDITLKAGVNTVKFVVNQNSADKDIGVNFGYIKVVSYTEVSDHVCASVCEDCGKCMDVDCQGLGCTDKCADHVSVTLDGKQAVLGEGSKGAPNFEAQRDALVGNLSNNQGATLTFTVNSEKGGVADLFVGITTRTKDIKFTDSMSITVNGVPISSDAIVPKTDVGDGKMTDNWYDWVEICLGEVTLQAGENTIVFERLSTDENGFNFHHIRLVQDSAAI